MASPFFSIVLPTYNRAHLIETAVKSVLSQTFSDWELIIVDDGSTDNTQKIINKFAASDQRIKYFYQENQERSVARNNGIEKSTGQYICFLDSDDYYLKDKLASFLEAIHGQVTKALFYDALAFETSGELGFFHLPLRKKEETPHEFLLMNPLGALQLCIPAAALKLEQFNPTLHIGEDVELWLRLANSYDFIAVNSNNTIAVEHEERSINLLNDRQIKDIIKHYNFIFNKKNYGRKVMNKTKNKIYGRLFFNVAKIRMKQSKKFQAIFWLLKSLFSYPKSELNKHIFYCLKNLIFGKIPEQYQQRYKC